MSTYEMLWDHLLPMLFETLETICQPQVLVVYLDKNDFMDCSEVELMSRIVQNVDLI